MSIGTIVSIGSLQINREYTATTPDINSHIYCYNPSTSVNSFCSVAMRVQNTTGNRGFFSYDVLNSHGWAVGVKGNDATNKGLYFNNGWAFGGSDILTILNNGNISISSTDSFYMTFSSGSSGWNIFNVRPTSLWGDGISTASETAGTKFSTMYNI